jgi:hypothetical protein
MSDQTDPTPVKPEALTGREEIEADEMELDGSDLTCVPKGRSQSSRPHPR